MMLAIFVSSASPVMVQDGTQRCVKSKQFRVYFTSDTTTKGPVFCKLKHRRKSNTGRNGTKAALQTSNQDLTLDFPFLHDWQTKKLIRRSKVLFIIRGLPGSGKSTIVKAITNTYCSSMVCSADDYFLQDGKYNFDAAHLSEAHAACQNKAKDSCNRGMNVVVVDNTNVRRWEMKFYLELAHQRDYIVVLVQPKTPWKWNPVELAARNKHGVDVVTLKRKVNQFDDVIPFYYAWFLNDSSSKQLCFIAECLLKECVQQFPAFSDRLLKQLHISAAELQQLYESTSDASDVTEIFSGILKGYYTRGAKPGCIVHCTAKFCGGGGRAAGAKTYHAQQTVQNSLGQAFTLEISSVCFSPRTVGARVMLSEDQLSLFDKPEEKDWNGKQPCVAAAKSSGGAKAAPRGKEHSLEAEGRSLNERKHGSGGKKSPAKSTQDRGVSNGKHPSPSLERGLEPAYTKPVAKGRGRSAHITLGHAQGFESRETNFDMLRLCDMEASIVATDADFVPVTGGRARYFGDGVCCVYFDKPLLVSTIYSGFY